MDIDREGWLGAITSGMHLVACKTSFFLAEKKEEKKKRAEEEEKAMHGILLCSGSQRVLLAG